MPDIGFLNFQNQNQSLQPGVSAIIDSGSPDIYFKANIPVTEVRAGREIQISFELDNKQSRELKDVNLTVYDHPCFISGNFTNFMASIKLNQTRMWTWIWKSDPSINLQKICPIRFKLSYESDYSHFQDIAVLPEGEYYQRESEGTLGNVPIGSTSSSSPLDIQLTFSENQPLIANQSYFMYINYLNTGEGYFDSSKIPNPDITLSSPVNIAINSSHCGDYRSVSANNYHLEPKDGNGNLINLLFLRGKATPTTCEFITNSVPAMDIKSLSLTATYKYELDNSISITVNP